MTKAVWINLAIEYLGPLAFTLLTGLISWATVEAGRWVRSKTRNETAASSLERIGHTVATTVADLEQTLGRQYAELAADGSLSKRDKSHLKELARNRVLARLTPEIKTGAQLAISDLNEWIGAKIEQAVLELKRSAPHEVTVEPYAPVLPDSGQVDFGGTGGPS